MFRPNNNMIYNNMLHNNIYNYNYNNTANKNNYLQSLHNNQILFRNKILFDMQNNLLKKKFPDLSFLNEKDNLEIDNSENIINKSFDVNNLKNIFENKKMLKIDNILNENFAEALYNSCILEKNWILASGIDKNKYEKKHMPQNDKINQAQIKNVSTAFSNDQFSYVFYRSMNGENMNYYEFTLRKILNSENFITLLNEITNLNLTKLNTLFMSKYISGNFLSTHSDKGNGRLAFVINLSKNWKPQYGGNLHFLSEDRSEIIHTFVPGFNNLIIFHVPENAGIPHYVSHIAPFIKNQRYAISGWFE